VPLVTYVASTSSNVMLTLKSSCREIFINKVKFSENVQIINKIMLKVKTIVMTSHFQNGTSITHSVIIMLQ